ncbi:MAG: SagB/ThcOx family dehydrogenase [Syntrophales bacterium]|nr:SagB/ThcOx family dehydrogenase [Syntrophales bacterium]
MKLPYLLGAVLMAALWTVPDIAAQDLKPINLVRPQMDSGRLLMHVLKERKSTREFSPRKLPLRVLSNLLWCAGGINRPASGKRTVPSAMNWQEIDAYVATAQGLYVYHPGKHRLDPVHNRDIRPQIGSQAFIRQAPVILVYVADYRRMGTAPPEVMDRYSSLDTGFMAQNVYLYCASEGLNTVVVGSVDRENLAKAMGLAPEQRVVVAQPVGYPPK